MAWETLNYDTSDQIAYVTFNRMEKYNAANLTMFGELAAIMDHIEQDPDIRVGILTGQGKSFCAGVDIESFAFGPVINSYVFIKQCMEAFRSVEEVSKPIIAAVNGYAFGFGLEIGLSCDITLASEKATFGLAEIKHGVLPAITVTRGLETIGRKSVSYLAMTGDTIGAQEAMQMGFVNKVVPHEKLMEEALAVANKIKQNAPVALSAVKRLLNRNNELHFKDVINFMPGIFMTEDLQEGMKAFFEKRRAVFKGA